MKINFKNITSFIVIGILIVAILFPTMNFPTKAISGYSTLGNNGEYWAYIVGVGEYAENPIQNRPDMLTEVNDFKNVLLQSPWWSEDHIKIITAEDATRYNILAGFRWLNSVVSSDDRVVVYLTTHGNHLNFDIPPIDEADKEDEMLVSYWGFSINTSFITDDQINIMLNQLKSNYVCLIVDSCYAGGFNDHYKLLKSKPEQQRVILMASREDEVSYSGGFGPYVIDGIRGYADSNQDGVVTVEEVFAYAEPRSYTRQHPTIYDGYNGEFPLTMSMLQKSINVNSSRKMDRTLIQIPNNTEIAETSVLCGYITDSSTNQPVENALINVSGRINFEEMYTNTTTTDYTGFYFMHVPAMRIRMMITSQGYCDKLNNQLQIIENKTYWSNISLLKKPMETAVIQGYITSQENNTPLTADISLYWQGSKVDTYRNATISDENGFFKINVAPGEIDLDFSKVAYYDKSFKEINLTDYQKYWLNITLDPFPLETSMVCGYITDYLTGAPFSNVRIDVTWVNFTSEKEYSREVFSNATGYFSTPIAPGELYIDIHSWEYNYFDPYRHDAITGRPLWLNLSLQQNTVSVDIVKPLRAIYLNNQRLIPCSSTMIIGSISIETNGEGYYGFGNWEIQKVEFYIDNNLKATINKEPYVWDWTTKTFGKHTIKVIAYSYNNDTAMKEIKVTKIL